MTNGLAFFLACLLLSTGYVFYSYFMAVSNHQDKDTRHEDPSPDSHVHIVNPSGSSPSKEAKVGLSVFFNIMDAWQVLPDEQRILLGQPDDTTFGHYQQGDVTSLPYDTLERISFVKGIYKALGQIFHDRQQAG